MDINQVKKINAVLPKRHSLSILYSAKVENGIATFTDLENWIEIKTDWKDGLYSKSNIPAQGKHSFDIEDIKDFPTIITVEKPKYVCSMNDINGAITEFCAKDEFREKLLGVYLDAEENKAVATDGHVAHYHSIKVSNSVILPQSFIKLSKSLNCNGDIFITTKYAITENNGVKIISKIIELPYVNYMVAIPQGKKSIDIAKYKDTIYNAVKAVVPFSNSVTKMIKFEGEYITATNIDTNKCVKVNIHKEIFPFKVGFNGAYLLKCLDVAQGVLCYSESDISAVTIRNKVSTTLLMPLRIIDEPEKTIEEYTELYPKTKVKSKRMNWRDLYEKVLIENKNLKDKIQSFEQPLINMLPKLTTIYATKEMVYT